tara:strand:+ start:506 stop:1366 length:861 start_codon:yes stop_codon:yes gene_type:complete
MLSSKENIGIFFGIIAFFLFATTDVAQKYATIYHSIFQIMLFRYLFLFIIAIIEAKRKKNVRVWKTNNLKLQLIRSLCSILETAFFVTSFRYLSLGDVHSVAALSPIIVVALSIIFLKEFVDKKIWFAIFFGFIGVLIILRPGFDVFNFKSLIPLGAAFTFAIYQILTKKVSEVDKDETSLFFTSLFGVITMVILASIYWVDFIFISYFLLPLIGIMMSLAHYSLIIALARAPANKIQPFHFSLIFWAIIYGFVFYNDVPDVPTVFGALIIALSGIYIIHQQRKNQ